ncbi:hypothetical protein Tco_1425143, partial [Tanacetum coccineum]
YQGVWCIFEDLNVVRSHDDRLNSQKAIGSLPDCDKGCEVGLWAKPFRVFDIWMEELDFFRVVEEAWKKEVRSARPYCRFRDRLKNVKASLRVWSKDRFDGQKEKVENLRNEAMRWELEAEK